MSQTRGAALIVAVCFAVIYWSKSRSASSQLPPAVEDLFAAATSWPPPPPPPPVEDEVWSGGLPNERAPMEVRAADGASAESKMGRRRFQNGAFHFRRNRKKVTELTSITSDRADPVGTAPARVVSSSGALIARAPKYRQSAAVKMKAEPPRPAAGGSMAQWLTDSWAPSGGAAAAPAAADAELAGISAAASAAAAEMPSGGDAAGVDDARTVRCVQMMTQHGVKPRESWGTLAAEQQQVWASLGCDERTGGRAGSALDRLDRGFRTDCAALQQKYGVVVDASWGRLPEQHRASWTARGCDRLLRDRPSKNAIGTAAAAAVAARQARKREHLKGGGAAAEFSDAAECRAMQLAHGVRPGASWGTLPAALQRRWGRFGCDKLVN